MQCIPGDLPALWRNRADFLREFGDPNSARLWELAATELERALQLFGNEALSLRSASRECGFTADHLGALVKRGRIPNAGRKGAPRIRREDLPPKKQPGGRGRPPRPKSEFDVDVLRVAQSFKEKR